MKSSDMPIENIILSKDKPKEYSISYQVQSSWVPTPELEFYASWNDNSSVKYRKIRLGKETKGELDVFTSIYFKKKFNGIDFKEMKKFKDTENLIIDGTSCFLTVKKDNELYDVSWTMGAIRSKYISDLYRMIRVCRKKNHTAPPVMHIE